MLRIKCREWNLFTGEKFELLICKMTKLKQNGGLKFCGI